MLRALVVIPTYNEAENIAALIKEILATTAVTNHVDVLVVDDNSPDGTAEVVKAYAATSNRIFLLNRDGKGGLASAFVEGFQWGLAQGYDVLVQMDGDGSHRPENLPAILEQTQKADFVIGSRYCWGGGTKEWPWYRVLMSRIVNIYDRLILRMPFTDVTSGFTAIRRSVFSQVPLSRIESTGYAFQPELKMRAFRAGVTFAEVPIVFSRRKSGKSKLTVRIIWDALAQVLRFHSAEVAH